MIGRFLIPPPSTGAGVATGDGEEAALSPTIGSVWERAARSRSGRGGARAAAYPSSTPLRDAEVDCPLVGDLAFTSPRRSPARVSIFLVTAIWATPNTTA